jgi:hypothetical protein
VDGDRGYEVVGRGCGSSQVEDAEVGISGDGGDNGGGVRGEGGTVGAGMRGKGENRRCTVGRPLQRK